MEEKPPVPSDRSADMLAVESIDLEDGTVAGRLFSRAADLRRRYFTRPVTTFTSKEGEKFKASADQVDIDVQDASNVRVWLKTHEKEITMTIGGLLVAAGAIQIQRNRSQRKKMSNRGSSYRRKPRK